MLSSMEIGAWCIGKRSVNDPEVGHEACTRGRLASRYIT